jgi:hypothetical protein
MPSIVELYWRGSTRKLASLLEKPAVFVTLTLQVLGEYSSLHSCIQAEIRQLVTKPYNTVMSLCEFKLKLQRAARTVASGHHCVPAEIRQLVTKPYNTVRSRRL